MLLFLLIACPNDHQIVTTIEEVTIVEEHPIVGDMGVVAGIVEPYALDVALFVDESGSMVIERGPSNINIQLWIDDLCLALDPYDDVRVGLGATDPGGGGIYPYWADSTDTTNTLCDQMSLLVQQMGSQSGERGIDAAMFSLQADTQFHRDAADTLVIFMSDEHDQSTNYSTTEYDVQKVIQHTNAEFTVLTAAIVYDEVTRNECLGDGVGTGYLDVADYVSNLCDASTWTDMIPALIEDRQVDHGRWWQLPSRPVSPDSIVVYVNDVEIDAFTYHSDTNRIELDDVQPPGAFIFIMYLIEPAL